uniref:Transmembrane protein n=1 Tax=Trichogramma kaykai TaxID=54128 RepID=A0ABD2XCB4_9HYME
MSFLSRADHSLSSPSRLHPRTLSALTPFFVLVYTVFHSLYCTVLMMSNRARSIFRLSLRRFLKVHE